MRRCARSSFIRDLRDGTQRTIRHVRLPVKISATIQRRVPIQTLCEQYIHPPLHCDHIVAYRRCFGPGRVAAATSPSEFGLSFVGGEKHERHTPHILEHREQNSEMLGAERILALCSIVVRSGRTGSCGPSTQLWQRGKDRQSRRRLQPRRSIKIHRPSSRHMMTHDDT